MSSLGIYLGPRTLSVAESDAKRLSKSLEIPHSRLAIGAADEKIPDDVKIVTALKEEFKKLGITAKEASLVMPGRDLIIRTFSMPALPQNELYNAVKFEAKKYIPFKLEELIFDFQVRFDRPSRKNLVLFAGIKRDVIEKANSILKQLELRNIGVEYAGFSMLRLIKAVGVKETGVVAVANVDLTGEDEVSFMVLENSFPLFNRDMILTLEQEGQSPQTAPDASAYLEKLKVELRISLDFYMRKFPTKNINSMVFIAPSEARAELEAFTKERNIAAEFIDPFRLLGKPMPYSSSILKAYANSLSKAIKTDLKIDLVPRAKQHEAPAVKINELVSQTGFKKSALALGILIAMLPVLYFQIYQKRLFQEELARIRAGRDKVAPVKSQAKNEELKKLVSGYKEKMGEIADVLNKRVFVTDQLDALPRILPKGVWLKDITIKNEEKSNSMNLRGSVYLGDAIREMELLNRLVKDIKANQVIGGAFKNINLQSVEQTREDDIVFTTFTIVFKGE